MLTKCDAIIESEIIAAEIIFSRFLSNGERYFFDFKKLNDTYGHLFGDEVLKMAAKVIQDNMVIDNSEAAFRYGGEEFVCILNCSEKDIIAKRVNLIRQQISELIWKDHENLKVTISGGAVRGLEHRCFNDALKAADDLLYKAKEGGKNQIII